MAAKSRKKKEPFSLDPDRFTGRQRPHFAVIDIGSNSVRLVVYDQLSRATFARFNEKSLCRLGEGRGEDGSLAQEAIDHTLRSMDRFSAISRAMDVERIDVLATEAVRRAPNGAELIDGIKERTGLETRILAGEEEAQFSALGVIAGFFRPRGLVGDIGGGSLDLAEVLDDRVGDRSASMPLGALPVRELLADGYASAKKHIDDMLKERLPPLLTEPTFYAVGGGWRALARIEIARTGGITKVTHGFEMDPKQARALAKSIARSTPEEVAAMPDAPSRRHDTLPASALVFDRVVKALKPRRVVFSVFGLREGWLYSQLPEEEKRLDPLIEGAQDFGIPRARVPEFAVALVRWTDQLFPAESPEERRLRVAVCALSDIGWREHGGSRAGECYRRLLELPFIGISQDERLFLAATMHARHAGKPEDPAIEDARRLLHPADLRRAQILGRALQLGYRFSGSVPSLLECARLVVTSEEVRIEVSGLQNVPDSDAIRMRLAQLAKAIGVPNTDLVVV